jgi:hypothetical protein
MYLFLSAMLISIRQASSIKFKISSIWINGIVLDPYDPLYGKHFKRIHIQLHVDSLLVLK